VCCINVAVDDTKLLMNCGTDLIVHSFDDQMLCETCGSGIAYWRPRQPEIAVITFSSIIHVPFVSMQVVCGCVRVHVCYPSHSLVNFFFFAEISNICLLEISPLTAFRMLVYLDDLPVEWHLAFL
jgi:hypothetical protein